MEQNQYNATVTGKILITPDLMILRVRTDEPREEFSAGQYTTIGTLGSEERSLNSVVPIDQVPDGKMVTRPYSIASASHDVQNFEFYISQVKSGQLTPRLFNLAQGSRMWVDDKILGIFTLGETPPNSNIVMIATGTGLAPYISFLRTYINLHRDVKLAVIHGAAFPWDLGYFSELSFIQSTFANFYYLPTLLRADESWTGLRGYVQDHLQSGLLESVGIEINPEKTHFFLCGNPKMVEAVSSYLGERNYKRYTKFNSGALHIEEY
jgi:ferredoxin--NADP+ reductase